ncbi:MAG: hypothetical protein HY791_28825 [Deltaproteobacteria bacterium]|nr:hypothetical protein [Deltaproteobacteria bacterium]
MRTATAFLGSIGLFALLATARPARGAELFYKWEKGKTHRFQAKSKDVMTMSGMGVAMNARFTTDVTFALAINKVKKDGNAEATLTIETFSVKDDGGRSLASLDGLPPSALRSLVDIDRKGGFKFKEELYLLVDDEGGNLLLSGHAGPTGASATARQGNEEVTVWATFDPKTGQLSGGATVKEVGKKKKKIKVRQDKPTVDLLPKQFLELLRLPEGAISGGADVAVATPGVSSQTKITATLLEETKELVRLKTTFKSDTEATGAPPEGDEDGSDDDESEEDAPAMPGMPGMAGMPGMPGMPGMGGGAKAGAGTEMGIKIDGEATTEMNPAKGTLERVKGTIRTRTSAAGMMSIETSTELELQRK